MSGLVALVVVIAVGWAVGRSGVLGAGAGAVLSRLSFFVATPALLLLVLADAEPAVLLSAALAATAGSAVLTAALFAALARWRWRLAPADLATGALASSYVNAGNLGVPIAVQVLGDAAFVAPVLLFQVLVMAPAGLAVLAGSSPATAGAARWRVALRPLLTPVVVGSALGVLVAATGVRLPPLVLEPLQLTAALAVPAALLSYGMSLHGAPRPASGDGAGQVWLAVVCKVLVQPALAWALGRWVAGLDGTALLAVTLTSALPTAQNVFVYAASYDRGALLARDVVLLSTVLCGPVLVAVVLLLG